MSQFKIRDRSPSGKQRTFFPIGRAIVTETKVEDGKVTGFVFQINPTGARGFLPIRCIPPDERDLENEHAEIAAAVLDRDAEVACERIEAHFL